MAGKTMRQSLPNSQFAQAPYLSVWKRRMACSQDERSVIKTNVGFFKLGVLLEDSDITIVSPR